MNKKEEQEKVKKMLDDLFLKDVNEYGLKLCDGFHKENNRIPTDEEMIKIIEISKEKVICLWNENPTNFKFVAIKNTKKNK